MERRVSRMGMRFMVLLSLCRRWPHRSCVWVCGCRGAACCALIALPLPGRVGRGACGHWHKDVGFDEPVFDVMPRDEASGHTMQCRGEACLALGHTCVAPTNRMKKQVPPLRSCL